MKIPLDHPSVSNAVSQLRKQYNHSLSNESITTLFEETFKCKVIPARDDPWALYGHLEFNEDKYQTMFLLKFDRISDE